MKKYNLTLGLFFLASLLTAQNLIVPASIVGSGSTDAGHPVAQAIDGQTQTAWKLSQGASSGWVELRFSGAQRIVGMDWQGTLAQGSTAQLWYQQNGTWKPFLAGTLDSASPVGWVDLSLDDVVATAVQWRLSGNDAWSSQLTELDVRGNPANMNVVKLTPTSVSASDNTRWSADETNLVDGDTRTSWRVEPGFFDDPDDLDTRDWWIPRAARNRFAPAWGEAAALITLGQTSALDAVKLYLPLALESDVTVEALVGTTWTKLGTLPRGSSPGWQRLSVTSMGLSAGQIRLRAAIGWNGAVQIGEVEIWGRSNGAARVPVGLLLGGPADLAKPVNLSFSSDGSSPVGMYLAVKGAALSTLPVELNGRALAATRLFTLRGQTIYGLTLGNGQLWTGDNFLRIAALPSATLIDAQLAPVVADGRLASGTGGAGDGLLYTTVPYSSGQSLVSFSAPVSLERLEVTSIEPVSVNVWAWVNNAWQSLQNTNAVAGLVTNQLKFDVVGNLGEIRVWGSPVTSAAPMVKVVSGTEENGLGNNGQDFDNTGKLVGWVSDAGAKVTVNSLTAKKSGLLFWVSLSSLNLASGVENLVTVTATDSQNRKGTQVVHLIPGATGNLTLDQGATTLYTKAPTYTISGQVGSNSGSVLVNGTTVPVSSKRFSTTVVLTEGLNLISIQWLKNNGSILANLVRQVVKNSQPVTLLVDSPLEGALVAEPTVDLVGRVKGIGNTSLTVNGKTVSTVAGTFSVAGLPLAEGANSIVLKATDSVGQSAILNLHVTRDTTAPTFGAITPATGAYVSTTLVPVSVSVTDASPSWVKVNQGSWTAVAGGKAVLTVPMGEGAGTLAILAIDAAGNQSNTSVNLTVDATPPRPFAVTATPSTWTSNTRPVVSFATTDDVAGVDHYTVAIDTGGAFIGTSPFMLPALADGAHTVVVTAFDRAGLSTSASAQVFVDTLPPPPVGGFDLIPGKDSIALSWNSSGESGESWRLERNPGWTDGVKTLTTTTLNDTGLTLASDYSYRVWAVDHAGNVGTKSPWVTVKVGQEVAPVTPSQPVVAEYQNVEVNIPVGALAPDVTKVLINELTVAALVTPPEHPAVGPIYQMTVTKNENGVETQNTHTDLTAPVAVSLTYDPAQIPAGYTEANLRAFYFDPMWSRWIPVDGSSPNPVTHAVSFSTNHFTDFSIQATQAVDLSPQQLRDVQFSPFATKTQQGPVRVSEQGGSVSTEFTELVLQGKNNFDLVLKRTWDTGTAQTDGTSSAAASTPKGADGETPWHIGNGWRINFPTMKWNGSGLWVKGADGEVLSLEQATKVGDTSSGDTRIVTLETHESSDIRVELTFKETPQYLFGFLTWVPVTPSYSLLSARLIEKDGREVVFDTQGRVQKMTDATGLNHIDFDYSGQAPVVKDSMGRVVTFGGDGTNLTSIAVSGGGESYPTITYNLDADKNLKSATDVGGRTWNYGYTTKTLVSSVVLQGTPPKNYVDPKPTSLSVAALSSVSGPGVGKTVVTYAAPLTLSYTRDDSGYTFLYSSDRLIAQSVSVSTGDADAPTLRTTNYTYNYVSGGHDQFYSDTSTVSDGRTTHTTTYDKVEKARAKLSDSAEAVRLGLGLDTSGQRPDTTEVVSVANTTTTKMSNGAVVETQTQQWDLTLMRPIQSRTSRADSNFTQTDTKYDKFGNVTSVSKQENVEGRKSSQDQTLSYYAVGNTNLSLGLSGLALTEPTLTRAPQNLLAAQKTVSHGWGVNGVAIADVEEDQAFTYTSLGQVQQKLKWTDTVWAPTNYQYEPGAGQVSQVQGPTGQVTQYTYDYTGHAGEYWTTVTQKAVLQSDGTTRDLGTEQHYRILTGDLVYSRDARNSVTRKGYDFLGRVTDITEPAVDVYDGAALTAGVTPTTHIEYHDLAPLTSRVTSRPTVTDVTYQFDGLGRLTSVEKVNGKDKVSTTLDYDGYGQVTAVHGPVAESDKNLDPSRTLASLVTAFGYDDRGRVISTKAPGASASRTTSYNDAKSQATTKDELGNTTIQTMTWDGRPLTQTTVVAGRNLTQQTYYDGAGRVIATVDPKGNATTVSYNSLGLEATRTLPARTVGGISTTPQTTSTYNDAGILVSTSKPLDGGGSRVTTNAVNGLGQVLTSTTPVTVAGVTQQLVVSYAYNPNGNRTGQTTGYQGSSQTTKTWAYDSHGRVLTETDEEGKSINYRYDSLGNRTQVRDPRQTEYPNLRFVLDLKYDQLNRLVEADLPSTSGSVPIVKMIYDGHGNLVQRSEPDGQVTKSTYTLRNQLKTQTTVKGSDGYTTTYDYDDAGRETKVTSPNASHAVSTTYDEANRVFTTGNNTLGRTTFTYDDNGNKRTVTDGRGNTTTYSYNADNQVTSVTDARGQTSTITYDRWNQKVQTQDAERNIRRYTYDQMGRIVAETTPWNATITNTYDAWNNLVSQVDASGTTFVRQYNKTNHLVDETATRGSTVQHVSYTYDSGGDLKTSNNGILTQYNLVNGVYTPNPFGLVTSKSETVSGTVLAMNYGYDNNQRLKAVTNPDGSAVAYQYNQQGQLESMTGWLSGNLNYDSAGRLANYTLINGVKKTVQYDDQDRLKNLTYNAATSTLPSYDFTYDKAGNIATKNQNTYSYDQLNQLTQADEKGWFQKTPDQLSPSYGVADRDYSGTTQLSFYVQPTDTVSLDMAKRSIVVDLLETYGVNKIELHPDKASHRVRQRDITVYGDGTKITGWTLSQDSQAAITLAFPKIFMARVIRVHTVWDDRDIANTSLSTKATFTNSAKELVKVWALKTTHNEQYFYDNQGDRIMMTTDFGNLKTSVYYKNAQGGNLPQIRNDGTWEYTYDQNGNRITKTKPGESWSYAWGLHNELLAVKKNGVQVVAYTYDAEQYRVQRDGADGRTVYAYGRNGALTYQKNKTTNTSRTFAYLNDQVVGWTDTVNNVSTRYYATTDHLGSLTAVTDTAGTTVWHSEYLPFGGVAGAEGSYAFGGGYTGQMDYDADTGLELHHYRWYDPTTATFASEDPARDGVNFYRYANGNPGVFTDPTGLDFIKLTDTDTGFLWFGHSASLVGSDKTGWTYLSKDGYSPSDTSKNAAKSDGGVQLSKNGNVLAEFATLSDFHKSPLSERYDESSRVTTSAESDGKMKTMQGTLFSDKANYDLFLNNCSEADATVARSGDLSAKYELLPKDLQIQSSADEQKPVEFGSQVDSGKVAVSW